jgi:alkylated DNA nucleotide flippase Atl1
MGYRKKSWEDKLVDKAGWPKMLTLERRLPCYSAVHRMGAEEGDRVVLVNPSEVTAVMAAVPNGKLITIVEVCRLLAKKHGAQACCSLTTGIAIMTAANAVEEAARQSRDLGIPYWRTLKSQGFLNEKYPGGISGHRRLLEDEGFSVRTKGKRAFVENYADCLAFDA